MHHHAGLAGWVVLCAAAHCWLRCLYVATDPSGAGGDDDPPEAGSPASPGALAAVADTYCPPRLEALQMSAR